MGTSVMHYLTLVSDFDGWDYAECGCGWIGPPCPDIETAAEFFAQHVAGRTSADQVAP